MHLNASIPDVYNYAIILENEENTGLYFKINPKYRI